ncbi:hypothetical protein LX32DRAFT_438274 [Colletotrichum zoysiae]|uniref:Uncharacterized protein n=1 Tax=Colletotrichum zoysiae TaxID=1216348 RepID=A0AAD9HG22_9PEZI|nr:hypothetical protein LX32DRAFT_438274 [Colletotrichum zoysiae]
MIPHLIPPRSSVMPANYAFFRCSFLRPSRNGPKGPTRPAVRLSLPSTVSCVLLLTGGWVAYDMARRLSRPVIRQLPHDVRAWACSVGSVDKAVAAASCAAPLFARDPEIPPCSANRPKSRADPPPSLVIRPGGPLPLSKGSVHACLWFPSLPTA